MINKSRFDLVLLDITAPEMSGYEVCRHIRENHTATDLLIIILFAKDLLKICLRDLRLKQTTMS
jgi:DNA-binding response OmpR family regulator